MLLHVELRIENRTREPRSKTKYRYIIQEVCHEALTVHNFVLRAEQVLRASSADHDFMNSQRLASLHNNPEDQSGVMRPHKPRLWKRSMRGKGHDSFATRSS